MPEETIPTYVETKLMMMVTLTTGGRDRSIRQSVSFERRYPNMLVPKTDVLCIEGLSYRDYRSGDRKSAVVTFRHQNRHNTFSRSNAMILSREGLHIEQLHTEQRYSHETQNEDLFSAIILFLQELGWKEER